MRKRPEHAWSWFLVRRRENYRNLKTDEAFYQLTYFLALLLIAIVLLSPAIVGLPLHISYGWPDPKRFNHFDQLGLAIDLIAMLCLLLVVVKLALICGRRLSAEFRRRQTMQELLAQFIIPCGFFVVVAVFCVQIWLWLLSVLGLNPVGLGLQWDNHHLVGTVAGTLLVVLALIYLYISSNRDFRFWRRNAAILALVTLLAAASALSLHGTTWKAVDSAVFAERASHLNSGVSPLLPAVLLIFLLAWRSVCQLKRLDLLGRAGSELPFPDENEESPAVRREGVEFERLDYAGIRKDGKRLIDSLESPFQYVFGWNWRTVVFVSVMVYLVLFGTLNHPFERSYFRDFATFGLLAASAAILINALEAQAVWECGAADCTGLVAIPCWGRTNGYRARSSGRCRDNYSAICRMSRNTN